MDTFLSQADMIGTGPIADVARPGILRALYRELADLQAAAAGDANLLSNLVSRRLLDSRAVTWTLQTAIRADPFRDEDGFHLAVMRLHHAIRQDTDTDDVLDAWRLLRKMLPWTDAWRLACDHARAALSAQQEAVSTYPGAGF